jgi:PP-loop superfamily ATP-utilizing enzyme
MQTADEEYLKLFYSLPDLLKLAIEQNSSDRYKVQDELREQYRSEGVSFRWSMPVRHFGHCNQCKEQFTEVIYQLENPNRGISAGTNASHIHAVERHGTKLDTKIKKFLTETD